MADRMFEAFSIGGNAIGSTLKDGNFKNNLDRYANSVSTDYMRHGLDMNKSIAKIASRENLNSDQIQRVVEESNNRVYLAKYAQLKNSNDRDVSFDRADAEKVASLNNDGVTSMGKIASACDEPLNAFNATRKLTGGLTPAAPMSLTKIVAEKLASDLSDASNGLAKSEVAFDAHIYKVAEMLVRYDRAGIDTGMAFDAICRKNNFNAPIQNIIQEAADDVISMEKKAHNMNEDYTLKLPFVDLSEKKDDYSLGSFSKIASMNLESKAIKSFPIIQIQNTLIKSLSDMVKFASEINTLFEDVKAKDMLFKEASERSTFTKAGGHDAE